jgi:nucleotide-binding universal stress UspA family protein
MRLICATDLSARSDRAVRRAAMLARACGAELLLLHVVDDDQPARLVEAGLREAAELLRAQVAGLAELNGLPTQVLVQTGDAFDAILRAAQAQGADLVVLGTPRRGLLRNMVVGTTAERVVRGGCCPVLMVNLLPTGPYRRILAAVDLSDASARALRAAAALGLFGGGAELTVLHAFALPGKGGLALGDAPQEAIEEHRQVTAEQAEAELARFLAGIGTDLGPAAPRLAVEEGRPATVVKQAVRRLRAELVLAGTGRHGVLHRVLLGSVAAELVAELDCDLLIALPPEPPA